jgi:hypothetical protein
MDGLRNRMRLVLAAATLGCALGSGCMSGDGGTYDPNDPNDGRYDEPVGPPVSRYDDGYDDRPYSSARAAPAPAPPPQVVVVEEQPLIPRTAGLRAEGRGDLSFKAPRDGFVYVLDSRDKKLVYEGPMDENETLLIAPYRNVIEIDGRRVKRVKDLDNKHIHKIFFERDSARRRGR